MRPFKTIAEYEDYIILQRFKWTSISWNGAVFAAVGQETGIVMTSPDGIHWTSRSALTLARLAAESTETTRCACPLCQELWKS